MFKEFIIYSVARKENTEARNNALHSAERRFLKSMGIQFVDALGVFQGVPERSLIVDRAFSKIVKERAWDARQECVLVVNSDYKAFLTYPDGNVDRVGSWNQATDEYSGDYTVFFGRKYFIKK